MSASDPIATSTRLSSRRGAPAAWTIQPDRFKTPEFSDT
jgi:hypothetical protein